ncbi:MAG: cupin domain-containing protein [Prosthecobacter sp.]
MLQTTSLFTHLDLDTSEEKFTTLFEKSGVKIERITSHGQATPEGFWYDQPSDEWVMVVRGEAVLEVQDQEPITMHPGDHVTIPRHVRHRVVKTTPDTLWLAVHVP